MNKQRVVIFITIFVFILSSCGGGGGSSLPSTPAPKIPVGLVPAIITVSTSSTTGTVVYTNFVTWDDSATDIAHTTQFERSATISGTQECDTNNKEIIIPVTAGSYKDNNLLANTTYCYYVTLTASNVSGIPVVSQKSWTTKSEVASNVTISNGPARAFVKWQTQAGNASFFDINYTVELPDSTILTNLVTDVPAAVDGNSSYYIKGLLPLSSHKVTVNVISKNRDKEATTPVVFTTQVNPVTPVLGSIKSTISAEFYSCLRRNGLTDLDTLDQIQTLNCANMSPPLKSLDGIDYLISLINISVARNEIASTNDIYIKHIPTLTGFNFSDNKLKDINGLTGKNVLWIDISNNPLDSAALDTLKSMSSTLISLHMDGAEPSDDSILSSLPILNDLSMNGKGLTDISFLSRHSNLSSLVSLSIKNNLISNVNSNNLASMTLLTTLDLSNNEITDVSPLAVLSALVSLKLQNNKFSDISSLNGLTAVKYLDLANNQITHISSLAPFIPTLSHIDLSKNPILTAEFTVLIALPNTATLYLNDIMPSDPVFYAALAEGVRTRLTQPQNFYTLYF